MTQNVVEEEADLKAVRRGLIQASEIKDPWTMWFMLRDVFNLLTMILEDQKKGERG